MEARESGTLKAERTECPIVPVRVTYSSGKWETQPGKEVIKSDGKVREWFRLVDLSSEKNFVGLKARRKRLKEMGEVEDTMYLRRIDKQSSGLKEDYKINQYNRCHMNL